MPNSIDEKLETVKHALIAKERSKREKREQALAERLINAVAGALPRVFLVALQGAFAKQTELIRTTLERREDAIQERIADTLKALPAPVVKVAAPIVNVPPIELPAEITANLGKKSIAVIQALAKAAIASDANEPAQVDIVRNNANQPERIMEKYDGYTVTYSFQRNTFGYPTSIIRSVSR